jgi:signal peptidase I
VASKGERVKQLKKVLLVSVPLVVVAALVVFISGVVPYKVYVLHTGSMSPTIAPRSAVIVHEHQYHVGEVVTFVENGQTVTHRLVSINAAGLTTTKGDANATADPWHVPKSQIIGGVVATMPEVGYWLVYLKSPLGAASVLLALVAIWQIWALGASASASAPAATEADESAAESSRRGARARGRHVRLSS